MEPPVTPLYKPEEWDIAVLSRLECISAEMCQDRMRHRAVCISMFLPVPFKNATKAV